MWLPRDRCWRSSKFSRRRHLHRILSDTVPRQSVRLCRQTARTLPSPSGDDMIGREKQLSQRENVWRGNMIHRLVALAPVILASISFLTSPPAHAQDVKLPPTMT